MGQTIPLDELERSHGRHLRAVAYRMLGSVSDAEDAVQDAFARCLSRSDELDIAHPRAFLTKVVTRLCLDRLKTARVRRERYVGPWLPEPCLDEPETHPSERADQVTFAMMVLLERLSPLERAAFLLHDVFGADYVEIAQQLGRSTGTCRKLVERARGHVRAERPRFEPDRRAGLALARSFFAATQRGDEVALSRMLVDDAVLYSDGGGKRAAALNPIEGAERIVRLLTGIRRRWGSHTLITPVSISGSPGIVARDGEGYLYALTFDVVGNGIGAVYIIRNPDKLVGLSTRLGESIEGVGRKRNTKAQ